MTVDVEIENTYECGETVTTQATVSAPAGDLDDDWWDDVVWQETGSQHAHSKCGSYYEATIIRADRPDLVGKTYDWG